VKTGAIFYYYYYYYYYFNRLYNPCGFWHTHCSWIFSESAVASNLEDQWLERSKSRHRRALVAEGRTMGEKWPRILSKVATSTSLLGSFTCRKFTIWDRRLYFPSEGRRAEEFFARKIRRFRPGLDPRTRVQKASTLPLDQRSRWYLRYIYTYIWCWGECLGLRGTR
jgi:hypothetical protein